MLDEQLAIITGLWATPDGERFDYDGTPLSSRRTRPALPKPVQQPRPPIIVGGVGTRRTPRLAATYADEFNVPFMPLDYFRPACRRRTRCVSRPRVAIPRRCGTRSPPKPASAQTMPSSAGVRPRSAVTPTRCARAVRAGRVAEVVDRLNAWAAAGAETAYLQILDFDDLDQLELIAAEIAPHV